MNVQPAGVSTPLTEREFRALYARLQGMARWGDADRLGALNTSTADRVLAGAREIRTGQHVSLAAQVETAQTADDPDPYRHAMTAGAEQGDHEHGLHFALDRIAMNIHGNADSHLDALSHVLFDGRLYNGVSADAVTEQGVTDLSVDEAHDGVVGRGVLLDIPRLRAVRWLEPGDHVSTDDFTAAERAQGVEVGPGDLCFVRVGHRRRRRELGPWDAAHSRAGLHPDVVELLSHRQPALLGSDSNNDTAPSIVAGVDFPVHVLAINALGLMLLDYLALDRLAQACEQENRWSFFCVVAPLRLPRATGSPINPIAVL